MLELSDKIRLELRFRMPQAELAPPSSLCQTLQRRSVIEDETLSPYLRNLINLVVSLSRLESYPDVWFARGSPKAHVSFAYLDWANYEK